MTHHLESIVNPQVTRMHLWEQKHDDIMELYALNEELIASVEQAADPEAQLELVEPLIEAIGESADLLSEEYIGFCSGVGGLTSKNKIEGSLRKVYMAIHSFQQKSRDVKNAAQQTVKKIKRQLEQVIANLVEFVTISLDRVMQKQDIDELNAHHASIALMLQSAKSGPQGAGA